MMAVARIETLRLLRDRVAISLIALVPAVQIALFGYAVNLDPKNVPIAIAGSRRFFCRARRSHCRRDWVLYNCGQGAVYRHG